MRGQDPVALLYEALGQMRARDGDLRGALIEIRRAARAVSISNHEFSQYAMRNLKARVPVEEAELLLQIGDYEKAIDVVSHSLGAESNSRHLRVQSLKVLIVAAIRLSPSAEELVELGTVFENTRESIEGHADAATKTIIHDVAALLAEARHDWHQAEASLNIAIVHCRKATEVGSSLKRIEDRGEGDAVFASRLGDLRARMEFVREAAENDNIAKAASRQPRYESPQADDDVSPSGRREDDTVDLLRRESTEQSAVQKDLSEGVDALAHVIETLKMDKGDAGEALIKMSKLLGASSKEYSWINTVFASANADSREKNKVIGWLESLKATLEKELSEFDKSVGSRQNDNVSGPILDNPTQIASNVGDAEKNLEGRPEIAGKSVASEKDANIEHVIDTSRSRSSRKRKRPRDREGMLIASMKTSGNNAPVCMTQCRYGMEQRHPWPDCLDLCIDNPLVKKTFLDMLPSEDHAAKGLEIEIPAGLQLLVEEEL